MNKSMNKRYGIWGVWLAAMMLCLGGLPGVATADEQDVAEETDEATAPPLAVAPFDAAAAKAHQEAWAKYLGVPVEVTNSIGMKFRLIPPGEFMVSPKEEIDDIMSWQFRKRKPPQPRRRITKPFYLGLYEVTQSHWERVMGSDPSRFKGPDHPVERVSWNDCQDFIRRLNARLEKCGGIYRLPTEAEWEYACRAGSAKVYSFGNSAESLGDYAWHSANSNSSTQPVGQKLPNAWGIYDMHGNVWEWCEDWYNSEYYVFPSIDDPQGPARGSVRVCRGGGWIAIAEFCRSSHRHYARPFDRDRYLGFRLALSSMD